MEAMQMRRQFWRSRWWMPASASSSACSSAARSCSAADPWMALWGFGLMAGLGALAFFARRSETIQGLSGPGRDERWAMIDLGARLRRPRPHRARYIGMWLYEIANGRDGNPYGPARALGGVAYIAGVAWGRFRR